MRKVREKKSKKNIFSIFITGAIAIWIGLTVLQKDKGADIAGEELSVRRAAVAGTFYEDNGGRLSKQIDEFYEKALLESTGSVKILISPHAAYEYSGQVAAYGYKQILGRDIHTVVIVGQSHLMQFDGIAVFQKGYWETPLGKVEVDSDMTLELINYSDKIYVYDDAHEKEHSIEVQIPFLQESLSKFKIVPVVMGDKTEDLADILTEALFQSIDEYTLVVISTDLAHYPSYDDANEVDGAVINSILKGETSVFQSVVADYMGQGIPNLSTCVCGEGGILVGMNLASKLGIDDIRLLRYANSGDVTGDKSSVVGYASIGFFTDRFGAELTVEEQEELLDISRNTLESYIGNGTTPELSIEHEYLNNKMGAFVTLKKNGELRGCIGNFEPTSSLAEVIVHLTIQSATADSRFSPVQLSELPEIKIEISVLSPRFKIEDVEEEIEIGKHGVYLQQGGSAGVFLPQVATEQGWDLETFLGELCRGKAGLPSNCWESDDTEIYVFTAQVFAEE